MNKTTGNITEVILLDTWATTLPGPLCYSVSCIWSSPTSCYHYEVVKHPPHSNLSLHKILCYQVQYLGVGFKAVKSAKQMLLFKPAMAEIFPDGTSAQGFSTVALALWNSIPSLLAVVSIEDFSSNGRWPFSNSFPTLTV